MNETIEFELNQQYYNRVIKSTDLEYCNGGYSRDLTEEELRQDIRDLSTLGYTAFMFRKPSIWDCPAAFGSEESIEYWDGYLRAVQNYIETNRCYLEQKHGEESKMDSDSQ